MDKAMFFKFLKELSEVNIGKNNMIQRFLRDAEELAEYGELRIALENLLENLIENDIQLNGEQIKAAQLAFGQNMSDYDKRLIDYVADQLTADEDGR